jgi:broad specificity phosphatase PhoE
MEVVAERLKGERIDVIFSSDLKRAKDSTAIIARFHDAPIHYETALRELNQGIFEGHSHQEYNAARDSGGVSEVEFHAEGGESYLDLMARVSIFARRLYETRAEQSVLVSTHTGVATCLAAFYLGIPIEAMIKKKLKESRMMILEVQKTGSKAIDDGLFE